MGLQKGVKVGDWGDHMLEGRRKDKLPPTLPGGVRTLRRDEKVSLGTWWGKCWLLMRRGACARSDD